MFRKLILAVMLVATMASGQESRRLVELHATLGTVITAEENSRYNLFGEIPDLRAVKCYEEHSGMYQLRIMAGNHLIMRRLSADDGWRLRMLIRKRVENAKPEAALKPVRALKLEKEMRAGFVKIERDDDSVLKGEIISLTADTVTLQTDGGVFISIPEPTIRQVRHAGAQVRQREKTADSSATAAGVHQLALDNQLQTGLVKVELDDGTVLKGEIQTTTEDTVKLRTPGGLMVLIPRARIRELQPARVAMGNGEFLRRDPNENSLFFAPTGRGLRRGQVCLGNSLVLVPHGGIGITNFLGVSGGVAIFPFHGQFRYLTPKISITPRRNLSIAAGLLRFRLSDEFDFSMQYLSATFEESRTALTAGIARMGIDDDHGAVFLVGGELQVSKGEKFIVESWIIPGGAATFIAGVRSFTKHLVVDFAFLSLAALSDTEMELPFIPWVDIVVSIGN
jgi:hypothetical protein